METPCDKFAGGTWVCSSGVQGDGDTALESYRLTHLQSRLWLKLRESMRWVQKYRGERVRGERVDRGSHRAGYAFLHPSPSRLLAPPGGSA